MKNSVLENLSSFEMSRGMAKIVNGGTPLGDCIRTAIRDGNEWLIPECLDILDNE